MGVCLGGTTQPGGGLRADAAGIPAGPRCRRSQERCPAILVNNAGYLGYRGSGRS